MEERDADEVSVRREDRGWFWGWFTALAATTILISAYDLDGGAGFETTDCWVAQTAREMRERGDWVIPVFSGETRMQKSPGPYWVVMLTSLIRGTPVDAVSARMQSALSAVLVVLSICLFARRIAGGRAAVFAGFAASSSVMVLHWSHRAASDLGVAALTSASLFLVWMAANEARGGRRFMLWMGAYFVAGVGMLYKMPMPVVCVGLPAAAYVLIRRRWRVLADWSHVAGLLVFCVPWLPWAIAVVMAEPTALTKWRVEFLDRLTGDLPNVEGQAAWPFWFLYVGTALAFALPWAASVPGALARPFMTRAHEDVDGKAFLLIWFASLLVFFTASVGKETRYFLPAMPPLFVLLGCDLSEFFARASRTATRAIRAAVVAAWIGLPMAAIGGFFGLRKLARASGTFAIADAWPAYVATAGILVAGMGLAAWLLGKRRGDASFATIVGTMYAAFVVAWPWLMPVVASQRAFVHFAEQVREKIGREAASEMVHLGAQDPRHIWYGDIRYPRLIDQLELLRLQGGNRSLANEMRLFGEEIIRRLSGSTRVLAVCKLQEYALFQVAAPRLCARMNVPEPATHIWIWGRVGGPQEQFVVFSNQPPTWEEPRFEISEKLREELQKTVDVIERAAEKAIGDATTSGSSGASSRRVK